MTSYKFDKVQRNMEHVRKYFMVNNSKFSGYFAIPWKYYALIEEQHWGWEVVTKLANSLKLPS